MKKSEFDKLQEDEGEFANKRINKLLGKFVKDAYDKNNQEVITLVHDIDVLRNVWQMISSIPELTQDKEFDADSVTLVEAGSILMALLTDVYRDTLED